MPLPQVMAALPVATISASGNSQRPALRVCDIDSKRMPIHVPEGKTGHRHVLLSPRVLAALRIYWKAARPKGPELFPGGRAQRPGTRLSRKSLNKVLAKVGRKADALLTLAADPKWLGSASKLGITSVLHTWTRDLRFHPHVSIAS